MESLELLAREEEFKKLNKQLEKKTVSLMKEIENVMQKPDFFSDFSHSLHTSRDNSKMIKMHCHDTKPINSEKQITKQLPTKITQENEQKNSLKINKNEQKSNTKDSIQNKYCECCQTNKNYYISESIEFLHAFISVNVQDNILPKGFSKEQPSVEGICKFLSSKVKLMQEQIDKMQTVINNKATQCDIHLAHCAELEAERYQLLNRTKNATADAAQARARNSSLQGKLMEKERLYKEQRSEADRLSGEMRRLRTALAQAEARCATHEDEMARMRQHLQIAKATEKEFRESSRNHSLSQKSAISCLETKNKNLTLALNKQNLLIENLKQQNIILSGDVMIQGLEREYSKLLLDGAD